MDRDEEAISDQELILDELLPIAEKGLKKTTIDDMEAGHYPDIIRERVSALRQRI